ncbi:unnamed protein product, partial [Mesorhabditis spiculigera]
MAADLGRKDLKPQDAEEIPVVSDAELRPCSQCLQPLGPFRYWNQGCKNLHQVCRACYEARVSEGAVAEEICLTCEKMGVKKKVGAGTSSRKKHAPKEKMPMVTVRLGLDDVARNPEFGHTIGYKTVLISGIERIPEDVQHEHCKQLFKTVARLPLKQFFKCYGHPRFGKVLLTMPTQEAAEKFIERYNGTVFPGYSYVMSMEHETFAKATKARVSAQDVLRELLGGGADVNQPYVTLQRDRTGKSCFINFTSAAAAKKVMLAFHGKPYPNADGLLVITYFKRGGKEDEDFVLELKVAEMEISAEPEAEANELANADTVPEMAMAPEAAIPRERVRTRRVKSDVKKLQDLFTSLEEQGADFRTMLCAWRLPSRSGALHNSAYCPSFRKVLECEAGELITPCAVKIRYQHLHTEGGLMIFIFVLGRECPESLTGDIEKIRIGECTLKCDKFWIGDNLPRLIKDFRDGWLEKLRKSIGDLLPKVSKLAFKRGRIICVWWFTEEFGGRPLEEIFASVLNGLVCNDDNYLEFERFENGNDSVLFLLLDPDVEPKTVQRAIKKIQNGEDHLSCKIFKKPALLRHDLAWKRKTKRSWTLRGRLRARRLALLLGCNVFSSRPRKKRIILWMSFDSDKHQEARIKKFETREIPNNEKDLPFDYCCFCNLFDTDVENASNCVRLPCGHLCCGRCIHFSYPLRYLCELCLHWDKVDSRPLNVNFRNYGILAFEEDVFNEEDMMTCRLCLNRSFHLVRKMDKKTFYWLPDGSLSCPECADNDWVQDIVETTRFMPAMRKLFDYVHNRFAGLHLLWKPEPRRVESIPTSPEPTHLEFCKKDWAEKWACYESKEKALEAEVKALKETSMTRDQNAANQKQAIAQLQQVIAMLQLNDDDKKPEQAELS